MGIPAIVHIVGEDAIYGELDDVPDPTHQFLVLRSISQKDRKPLNYIDDRAEIFLYAWHRITFVELLRDVLMPSSIGTGPKTGALGVTGGLKPAGTTVLGFFRDDDN
jgi:hypothetical protein